MKRPSTFKASSFFGLLLVAVVLAEGVAWAMHTAFGVRAPAIPVAAAGMIVAMLIADWWFHDSKPTS